MIPETLSPTPKTFPIKVDGEAYPCCKRYYMFSVHSYRCQMANNFSENYDLEYAKLQNTKTNPTPHT